MRELTLLSSGKHATKITSEEAFVQADDYVRSTDTFRTTIAEKEEVGETWAVVDDISLETIYGSDYKQHVLGKSRVGSKKNPAGIADTDFTDGSITSVYKKDAAGQWALHTMYPNPKA